jgi:hypothetical protein
VISEGQHTQWHEFITLLRGVAAWPFAARAQNVQIGFRYFGRRGDGINE